jgi:hypothetical protein
VLRRTSAGLAWSYPVSSNTELLESAMSQMTPAETQAPSFLRPFVGFLSSITVMTAAMVLLGNLSA